MANHRLAISSESDIEFESVTAGGQRAIERSKRIFGNRTKAAGTAMSEKKRGAHGVRGSVQIEVADGLAGVRSLFRFLQRFLELLFQQVGGMFLRLD